MYQITNMLRVMHVYAQLYAYGLFTPSLFVHTPPCPVARWPTTSTKLLRTMADRSASPAKADERPRKAQKREKRRLQKHASQCKMLKHALSSEIERPETISGETIEIQHGRLQAEAAAAEILARAGAEGGKVTDGDVLLVFRLWSFRKNDIRVNVTPEGLQWVYSDTLGLIRDRCGQYIMTGPTKADPRVVRLVNAWMRHCWTERSPQTFCCTSISVNSGYAAKLHRDRNNHGPSICKAVGDFSGGLLGYFADDNRTMELRTLKQNHEHEAVYFHVKSAFQLFDGNRAHWVEPYEGERISFVFFTVGKYWKANPDVLADLRDCGFEIPTPESMAHAESLLPQPRGYGARRLPKMASLPDMFGKAQPRHQVVKRAWEVPREASPKKEKGEHNVLDWLRCR